MKKFLKKNSELKIKDLRSELSRTYLLIAIISIIAIVSFRLGAFIQNDEGVIASILLIIGLGVLSVITLIASFTWINLKK